MVNTLPDNRTSNKRMLPEHYAQAASWLTYHEWKRLISLARTRNKWVSYWRAPDYAEQTGLTEPARTDFDGFEAKLEASPLRGPVKFTLLVMKDLADTDLHLSVSKARLGNLLDVDQRTIQRHFKAAEFAGFLTRHDYPQEVMRPSEFWLWAGDAPRRDDRWDEYDVGEMVGNLEPFEGW